MIPVVKISRPENSNNVTDLSYFHVNYVKRKKELLVKLQQRLEEETRELFFVCQSRCVRLNFDQATDFEFHCPECGELSSQDNNAEKSRI